MSQKKTCKHINSPKVHEKMLNIPNWQEAQIKTTLRLECLLTKRRDTKCCEHVEKRESLYTVGGNCKLG